jgi:uncharacterized protein YkwD
VIRAGAIWAIHQSATLFVALAVQIVAVLVLVDVFSAAIRFDSVLPPPGETVARVAPLARGERLMITESSSDPMRDTAPAPATQTMSVPTADVALAAMADLTLAPAAEVPSAPEAAPERAPEPPVAAATAVPTAPPTQRPAAAAPVMTTSTATHEAELRMLGLMNLSRVNAGLAPLALDAGVSEAARRHSAVEAQHRYVYHDGPDGTAKSRYVPACGSGWYGENTGKVWGGGVDVLHREFMAEPWEPINHRTNIMDPNFRRAGIGAVLGPDALYITVAFCR